MLVLKIQRVGPAHGRLWKCTSSCPDPTTQQKVEQAVADEERFCAQYASRDADMAQAHTLLRSNEAAAEAERRTP